MDYLSDTDTDEDLWKDSIEKDETVRFEDQIKLHHLKALMQKFALHEPTNDMPPDGLVTPGRVVKRESGNVTVEEFKQMIRSLFKTTAWDVQMENLFAKVDTSADGMVDWNEFCTYMLLHYRENDNIKKDLPFKYKPHFRHVTQNKQEIIQCVVALENPPRYVTLSKEGMLCVLDANFLHVERSYELKNENEDPRVSKRRCKTWYTDITTMCNVNKIVISSTGRDLRFWDVSCPTRFFEDFHLYALPDVPECLDYWYDPKHPSSESLLIVGDDQGSINLYHFIKPFDKLFETPFTDKEGVKKIWAQDLPNHQRYVRHTQILDIHTEMIRKVRYLPDNDYIISSSGSKTTSLVLGDTQGKKKTYTFKIIKGVECFDFNKTLNVIATGCIDHSVQLWNPFVQERPTACLKGHMMAVVGVVINEATAHVYTCAKDGVIKVWDLKEYSCLQTYPMRFPCLQHLRSPEYGSSCLVIHHRSLVACCGDYLGTLNLGKTEMANCRIPVTHKTQLCCAIYNSFFKQVATAANDSTITVWDLNSGVKSFSILEAHNREDITSMVFNTTGRKLITGARNGTIKVWNFQNGHNINQFEPVGEAEITGLVSLGKKKGVLAVGWSRQIVFYNDQDAETLPVKAYTGWKGGQVHNDDILAVDYCPPNLLATACFDGEIILWSVETETVFIRLRKGQSCLVSKRLKDALSSLEQTKDKPSSGRGSHFSSGDSSRSSRNSRPNTRHQTNHKQPTGFTQAPVDKILFLKSRIINKGLTEGAVLISSEAGFLHFWSIHGFPNNHKGFFYASNSVTKEESVLAMATNHDDSMLITGDTMGHVYLWDISKYYLQPTGKDLVREETCRPPPIQTCRPPLIHTWRAHDLAVVSVNFIRDTHSCFVLTASTDWTARLWTMEGHYIGTFGQSKKWNLRNPDTYEHPKTPWSHLEEKQTFLDAMLSQEQDNTPDDDVFVESLDQAVKLNNNNNIIAPTLQQTKDQGAHQNESVESVNMPSIEASLQTVRETASDKAVTLPSINTPMFSREPVRKDRPKVSIKSSPQLTNDAGSPPLSKSRRESNYSLSSAELRLRSSNTEESGYGFVLNTKTRSLRSCVTTLDDDLGWRSSRSMTLSSLESHSPAWKQSKSDPSLLGRQVDEDFARITHSRHERRQRCGGVNVKATQRFGKLCSPFQALTTLKTTEVLLPSSLPMTPSMLTRGLTCSNEAELRTMTLSPTPGELYHSGFGHQATTTSPLPAIRRTSRTSWNR